MARSIWNKVVEELSIPAKPDGFWTLVCEDLQDFRKLKIVATGEWKYSKRMVRGCAADGDPHALLDVVHCLCPQAPVGALIGKFGGSTAGTSDAPIFIAGQTCIIEPTSDKKASSLFLTINDAPNGFHDNSGELKVSVYKTL